MSITPESNRSRLLVLASGRGSHLQAFIEACSGTRDDNHALNASISAVISNRPDAMALQRARDAGIDAIAIDHNAFATRELYDHALLEAMQAQTPDWVILAGYMRIMSDFVVQAFSGRMLNIHPSLLPKYTGINTHARALAAGDAEAGATTHFVTPELDAGPPIMQVRVPIHADDDPESLAGRVLALEHALYLGTAELCLTGRVQMRESHACLDGAPLARPLQYGLDL